MVARAWRWVGEGQTIKESGGISGGDDNVLDCGSSYRTLRIS